MILYQLKCAKEHQFEAWFKDSATYDAQCASGDIDCPFCGNSDINKAPMAPHVPKKGRDLNPPNTSETRAEEVAEQILKAVGKIRKHIEENFDDVGDKFADEARRIHYGETDERDIYGKATEEEISDLDEEEIPFARVPSTPRRND